MYKILHIPTSLLVGESVGTFHYEARNHRDYRLDYTETEEEFLFSSVSKKAALLFRTKPLAAAYLTNNKFYRYVQMDGFIIFLSRRQDDLVSPLLQLNQFEIIEHV